MENWARSRIIFWGLCLISAILIVWRYQVFESRFNNSEVRKYNDSEKEVVLIGKVVKEPDVRETNTKLTIEASEKILVTISRYPEYKYGDELKITGQLETPAVFDDFNYNNYLKKDGIYSVIYYPKVELLSRKSYRDPVSIIFDFKDRLRQVIYRFLSPPQSEILGGKLLGDSNRMSLELK
ncbi:MAG: ComEC/Rec2 family competence protein, partial [bacterium]|nr:ComEC/Rec2 family competence protein [bacterium]